jgi:hypothetical protein
VEVPAITVRVLGVADIVKSGGGGCAVTTRLTVVVCVRLPLTPVIVTVDVPTGVLPVVVTVNAELPDPVTVAGAKLAVAPAGSPLALSVTTPVNPFNAPIFAVYVVAFPTITVCVLGVADNVKSATTARGTIWIPLSGARGNPSLAVPGVAVIVNPVAVTVNFT